MIIAGREPAPVGRLLCLSLALLGTLLATQMSALILLLGICIAILIGQGNLVPLARFGLRIWLPLTTALCIVWGFVVRVNPSTEMGGTHAGLNYAVMIALRVGCLVAVFQVGVFSQKGLSFAAFLSRLGVPAPAIAVLMSILILWPDFSRQADQVVAARCARGLMPNRHLWTRIRQVPWAFRTLFVSSLGRSLDRARRWEAEGLPQRLAAVAAAHSPQSYSIAATIAWLAVTSTWLIIALCPLN